MHGITKKASSITETPAVGRPAEVHHDRSRQVFVGHPSVWTDSVTRVDAPLGQLSKDVTSQEHGGRMGRETCR